MSNQEAKVYPRLTIIEKMREAIDQAVTETRALSGIVEGGASSVEGENRIGPSTLHPPPATRHDLSSR